MWLGRGEGCSDGLVKNSLESLPGLGRALEELDCLHLIGQLVKWRPLIGQHSPHWPWRMPLPWRSSSGYWRLEKIKLLPSRDFVMGISKPLLIQMIL